MLRRLARHRWMPPLIIAVLSLLISALLSLLAPLPVPKFHDEFSYLLAGETFAQGRLTNSPIQFWWCSETFQVIAQPTYMSKYPPVQGIILGLGKLIFGLPIAGVWISTALATASAWWALAGLVPRRWALPGALIAAVHPLLLNWNWSYWGGAGAMIGGCLLVGAIARVKKSPNILSGAMLGLGIGILLNSRPFEGAVLTLMCVISAFFYRSHGRKSVVAPPPARVRTSEFVITALIFLSAIAAWTAYYNYRVTGSAAQFPYMLYEKQYAVTPPLIWLPPRANVPEYGHRQMFDYYLNWEMPRYFQQRTLSGLSSALQEKSWSLIKAYFGSPVLIIPVTTALLLLWRDRKLRVMSVVALMSIAAAFSGLWFFPHYTAPAAIVFLYIAVQGLRHIRAGFPGGRTIVGAVLCLHVCAGLYTCWTLAHPNYEGWHHTRAQMQAELSREGRHLVIVRSENAYGHFDWVYNDPDPELAAVVWARDMGADENRRLIHYCRDRTVWLLTVDAASAKLDPYPK